MREMTEMPRTVIVTGGTRGLGLAMGQRLALCGYQVVAVARGISEAFTQARLAIAQPQTPTPSATKGALEFASADLSDIEGLGALVTSLRQTFGPIYGLVNNAGLGTDGILATARVADIERLVRLNTLSPMVLTKHVVRSMMADLKPGQQGRIVNISSIVATTGYSGLSVYGATKASLVGFTRGLAREVGRLNITVNAVAPGFIMTEMTGDLGEHDRARIARRAALGRLAMPQDVAGAVAYLLSEAANNVTGTVLTVDAGTTA